MHMLAHWLGKQRLRSKEFMTLVRDETGMSSTVFYELLKEAEAAGLIKRDVNDKNFWIKK
jgi:DNA-binding HxlR family transcriptional regulator